MLTALSDNIYFAVLDCKLSVDLPNSAFILSLQNMAIRYDLAVGLNKGHSVTKNVLKPRASRRKGVSRSITVSFREIFGNLGFS